LASFDPDAIYNYTSTRPINRFDPRGQRRIEWPALELTAIEVPEAPHDLLVLVGPEPDLRWREWTHALMDFATQLQTSMVVSFGAFLAQVNFSGPPALMGVSLDPQTRARLRRLNLEDSNYQGPTGISSAIMHEAAQRGIHGASLWAAAPSYLSSTSNPKLAAALLGAAEQLIEQGLWKEELEIAGRDMERRVQDALKSRPDLVEFLKRLRGESPEETSVDDVDDVEVEPEQPQPADEPEELPSSQEILRDLEEHLRRLKGDSEPGYGSDGD
jgi:proteasome assembly chaperone (PAC2) family protein